MNPMFFGRPLTVTGLLREFVTDERGEKRLLLENDGYTVQIDYSNVPEEEVEWHRDKVGKFKTSAVIGTVWRNDRGQHRAFIVNISGEEQKIRFLPFGRSIPLTVTLPPRSVKAIP